MGVAGSPAEALVALAAEHRAGRTATTSTTLGHPSETYAACAERLDGLVTPVIAALVKTMPVGSRGPP